MDSLNLALVLDGKNVRNSSRQRREIANRSAERFIADRSAEQFTANRSAERFIANRSAEEFIVKMRVT